MLCLSASSNMFVNIILAVCMLMGDDLYEKAASVYLVNYDQSVYLQFVNVRLCC